MGRALGIDLGTRRIGVAVTDALGLTAQPLKTVERHGGRRDMLSLEPFVRTYEIERFVVGLPLNPGKNMEEGRPAKAARAFGAKLEAHFGLPVSYIDESYTTVEALDVLLAADLSREKRKAVVDKLAATLILQRWLASFEVSTQSRAED